MCSICLVVLGSSAMFFFILTSDLLPPVGDDQPDQKFKDSYHLHVQ